MTTTAANGNGTPSTTIEKKIPTRIDVLKKHFEAWRPTLAAVLPKHVDPERVIKIAMNVYLNKPELAMCTPISMVKATLQCAELGLDPSPLLNEAWFLPFENKKKVKDGNIFREEKVPEVQLMPGYVGLIKLAKQTGDVSDVYAVVVDKCEASPEFFQVTRGTVNEIHHVMRMDVERTGELHAVYAVVKFKDGTHHFEVLAKPDVDAIRMRSKAANSGPWVTDYNAMARKSAIKQALKTIPKSPERPNLAKAIAADNAAETGEAFRGDLLSDVIDTTGDVVADAADATASASSDAPKTDAKAHATPAGGRTADLASKLAANAPKEKPPTVTHDPVTGEVSESEMILT
jgi:recombination protein RecT